MHYVFRLSKKVWKSSDLKHLWSGCQNSNLQNVLIRIRNTIWLQWTLIFGTFCIRLKKPNDDKIGSTHRMTHCRCISGCKKCCSCEWLYYFTPNEIWKNGLSIQCQHTEYAIILFFFKATGLIIVCSKSKVIGQYFHIKYSETIW